jgi:tellurite methyltransferase
MMNDNDRQKWNNIFKSSKHDTDQAADVLTANLHLLPGSGTALDLACGLGANAILLAETGLSTHAWDISDVAIGKLQARAADAGLSIQLEQRDIIHNPPTAESFDLIIISRFLDRSIIDHIIRALKINGLLYYQTFTRNKSEKTGPENPDYLLGRNELLMLFESMTILFYREDDRVGDLGLGNRNEAMLVAQKL